jgi:hypothetical protein
LVDLCTVSILVTRSFSYNSDSVVDVRTAALQARLRVLNNIAEKKIVKLLYSQIQRSWLVNTKFA